MQPQKTIVFYEEDSPNKIECRRILLSTGCECHFPANLEELSKLLSAQTPDILILETASHQKLAAQKICLTSMKVVLLSQDRLKDVAEYLTTVPNFTNFIAKNKYGRVDPKYFMITINSLLTNDIFGIRKFMNWGATYRVFYIRYSRERREYIDTLMKWCREIGIRNVYVQSVQRFAEEVLMNAIYDAPRDKSGNETYASVSRTEPVLLRPEESARLEIACDGHQIALSVTDWFGAISAQKVVSHLLQGHDKDRYLKKMPTKGGAGLGLYICYNSVSNFTINVSPNRRTEFIGVFNLSTPPQDAKFNHATFNFFSTEVIAEHLYLSS